MRRLEHLDGVLSLIDREFGEMEQNGKFRNKEDVEILYKMMDIAKDAAEICEKQMEMNGGYSEYGYPVYGNSYYDGKNYFVSLRQIWTLNNIPTMLLSY